MAFSLKNTFWKLLGPRWAKVDSYKDDDLKGLAQRSLSAFAEEYDEQVNSLISELIDNTVIPATVLERFLPYLEQFYGVPFVHATESIRRKMIRFAVRANKMRGSERAIELLVALLGYTGEITIHTKRYGFDSDYTLDDDARVFDSSPCQDHCFEYTLAVTGAGSITTDEIAYIYGILEKNQPIDAKLREVTYNGSSVIPYVISISINGNGELVYNNDNDPDLFLSINSKGELIVSGPRASQYSINSDGDLIFTL